MVGRKDVDPFVRFDMEYAQKATQHVALNYWYLQ
jgi:hypothetical protein